MALFGTPLVKQEPLGGGQGPNAGSSSSAGQGQTQLIDTTGNSTQNASAGYGLNIGHPAHQVEVTQNATLHAQAPPTVSQISSSPAAVNALMQRGAEATSTLQLTTELVNLGLTEVQI